MTKVGDQLQLAIDPNGNAGQDHAPAIVTGVHEDGRVDVTAFVRGPGGTRWVSGVAVYASRDAAEADHDNWAVACYRPDQPAPAAPVSPATPELAPVVVS